MSHLDVDVQQMLADSVTRWAEGVYTNERRGLATAHAHGCPPAGWQELGEMGWLGLALSEDWGGVGGSTEEMGLLAEGFGRVLLQEPYVSCGVMALSLLNKLGTKALAYVDKEQILTGQLRLCLPIWDPGLVGTVGLPQMQAHLQEGQHYVLYGSKEWMIGVGGADYYLLVAHIANNSDLGIFLVAQNAEGLRCEQAIFYDDRHAGRLSLDGSPAVLLLQDNPAVVLELLNQALHSGIVAYCAELAGVAYTAFELTREYVCERRQFGRAIGSNQVIQHRLVDLYVLIEEVRAFWRAVAGQPDERQVTALLVQTQKMADKLWQEALQLHGAIGMTEEYKLGAYLRRLAVASTLFGNRAQHLDRLAALELEVVA
ncbi:acyl-CoA dehydrogenase family protein [Alcaligenes endophyticus]|uniref:Acyl-CoA dehydrogenase n=1 Tax=Alcaligenes endophyticus TaxID=1929088 RepID=A0ABT8EJW0_9BURK|nr:acyl-CoA dehydrogenase [Alcaligenes endophyticus]MCX5591753.1 acyl-CoA dehydrogenase [Alcaligenes endophyticus]MDN4121430.1 acyl-CoA dehydrogenase [Alcaligenes endophyticus]